MCLQVQEPKFLSSSVFSLGLLSLITGIHKYKNNSNGKNEALREYNSSRFSWPP